MFDWSALIMPVAALALGTVAVLYARWNVRAVDRRWGEGRYAKPEEKPPHRG